VRIGVHWLQILAVDLSPSFLFLRGLMGRMRRHDLVWSGLLPGPGRATTRVRSCRGAFTTSPHGPEFAAGGRALDAEVRSHGAFAGRQTSLPPVFLYKYAPPNANIHKTQGRECGWVGYVCWGGGWGAVYVSVSWLRLRRHQPYRPPCRPRRAPWCLVVCLNCLRHSGSLLVRVYNCIDLYLLLCTLQILRLRFSS
jgi:hypothetical protein